MVDWTVLAAAVLLPLLLLFSFVGYTLDRKGLAEGVFVVIGPGTFATIHKSTRPSSSASAPRV